MTILGIDHVQVAAPSGSEEEARSFYGHLLGLTELPKAEALRSRGGVWFQLGKQQLHVGIAEPFVPAEKAHPALAVSPDGLTALAETLAHAGVAVTWDDSLPAAKRFYVNDPWGNRLEFVAAAMTAHPPDPGPRGGMGLR